VARRAAACARVAAAVLLPPSNLDKFISFGVPVITLLEIGWLF
jgi:hypothetical protein